MVLNVVVTLFGQPESETFFFHGHPKRDSWRRVRNQAGDVTVKLSE